MGFALGLGAAELGVGPAPDLVQLADEPVRLIVTLRALQVDDAAYVRASWSDELEWSVTNAEGHTVAVHVSSVRRGSERTVDCSYCKHAANARSKTQDWRISEAFVELEPLGKGQFEIKVSYRDVSASVGLGFGDPAFDRSSKLAKLHRAASRPGISWEEYRAVQFEKIKLDPGDWTYFWELGWRALRYAPLEEADSYWARCSVLESEFMARMTASADEHERAIASRQQIDFERRQRVISAIRALIPEYYRHRDGHAIDFERNDGVVAIIELPGKSVVRAIDVRPPSSTP